MLRPTMSSPLVTLVPRAARTAKLFLHTKGIIKDTTKNLLIDFLNILFDLILCFFSKPYKVTLTRWSLTMVGIAGLACAVERRRKLNNTSEATRKYIWKGLLTFVRIAVKTSKLRTRCRTTFLLNTKTCKSAFYCSNKALQQLSFNSTLI